MHGHPCVGTGDQELSCCVHVNKNSQQYTILCEGTEVIAEEVALQSPKYYTVIVSGPYISPKFKVIIESSLFFEKAMQSASIAQRANTCKCIRIRYMGIFHCHDTTAS